MKDHELRNKYDGKTFKLSSFSQTAAMGQTNGTIINVPAKTKFLKRDTTKQIDVGEGVCRELCRMWILARATPSMTTGLGDEGAGMFGKFVAPEVAFLEMHLNTIMVSQAMHVDKQTGYKPHAVRGFTESTTFEGSLMTAIGKITINKCIGIMSVKLPGGSHAIAVDNRNGFVFFDPNTGMWIGQENVNPAEFLVDYFNCYSYGLRYLTILTPT